MREVNRRTRRRSSSVLFLGLVLGFGASAHAQTPVDAAPETTPPVTAEQSQGVPAEPAPAEPSPPAAPTVPEPPAEEAVPQAPLPPARAGISGVVIDRETQDPLAGARVIIEGNGRRRTRVTDAEGRFEANLRSGTYSVRAVYPMYRSARRSSVRVDRGRRTEVDMPLRLFESDEEVIDVAIHVERTSDRAVLALREQSASQVDAIGQEAIRRSPDSNASGVVRRVVGASVEEGSRLVVRGLGDRYSTVLMNGVPLPSTDPDRPGIQLDIIPASVIANLSIAKTFTPDMAANWAGGLMTIETVSFPEEFTLRGGFNLGYNSETTFRQRLDYNGGRFDALGIDDGDRALPDSVGTQLVRAQNGWMTEDRVREIVQSLGTDYEFRSRTALPNMSFNLSVGDSLELREDRRFGYLVALTYSRNEQIRRGPTRRVLNNNVDPDDEDSYVFRLDSELGTDEVLWSAFGTASFQYSPRGSVRLVTFYTQSATDEVRLQTGVERGSNEDEIEQWQLRFVSRGVLFVQVAGEQRELPLPPHSTLRWSLYTSRTDVNQPDTRQVGYSSPRESGLPFEWTNRANSSERIFTDLNQQDLGGYLHLRTPLWENSTLALGADVRLTTRSFELRQFRFLRTNSPEDLSIYQASPNVIFAPENVGSDGLVRFQETTARLTSYDATQRNLAGFLMLDTSIGEHVRFVGGVRVESFSQGLDGYLAPDPLPFSPDEVSAERRTDVDWLPSVSGIFDITPSMKIRASYAMTLARPTLREIAPFAFYDFVRRRTVTGNADLNRTQIHNADLRWEWFPSESEVVAASVFYKYFVDPIEQVTVGRGVDDLTYANGDGAYDVGVELEAQVDLERVSRALRFLHLNGNVAIVQSRVRFSADTAMNAADASRGLISQSPYVANLSLRFDHPDSGLAASVIYNAVGRRVAYLGTRFDEDTFIPDTYELAFHSLDFSAAWTVSEHVSLRLTGRNLLHQRRRFVEKTTNGDAISIAYQPGTDISLGLSLAY